VNYRRERKTTGIMKVKSFGGKKFIEEWGSHK
jgi:hypothetical protein